jgi:SAM-dependent methyltransferase
VKRFWNRPKVRQRSMSPLSEIATAYQVAIGRRLGDTELRSITERVQAESELVVFWQAIASAEFTRRCLDKILPLHLLFIHGARLKLVASMLPAARRIVDLGGANGNLHEMGYPHMFDQMIVVDLPPAERCEMYRDIKMESRHTSHGPIAILYSNVTDLSRIPDSSTDLVWMGQTIEHVSEQDSHVVYREVKRILRPGGHFCLDTPNRNLTEIHAPGWIHPEHQIEYRPEHLRRNLEDTGFRIELQLGLCEMVRTWQTKVFDYTDFFLGGGLSSNVAASYVQYYHCRTA